MGRFCPQFGRANPQQVAERWAGWQGFRSVGLCGSVELLAMLGGWLGLSALLLGLLLVGQLLI